MRQEKKLDVIHSYDITFYHMKQLLMHTPYYTRMGKSQMILLLSIIINCVVCVLEKLKQKSFLSKFLKIVDFKKNDSKCSSLSFAVDHRTNSSSESIKHLYLRSWVSLALSIQIYALLNQATMLLPINGLHPINKQIQMYANNLQAMHPTIEAHSNCKINVHTL